MSRSSIPEEFITRLADLLDRLDGKKNSPLGRKCIDTYLNPVRKADGFGSVSRRHFHEARMVVNHRRAERRKAERDAESAWRREHMPAF